MNNLYVPYYNHIFRKCSRTSPDDFRRLPGLKFDDLRVKNNDLLDQKIDLLKIDRDPRGSIGDCPKVVMGRNMGSVDLQ